MIFFRYLVTIIAIINSQLLFAQIISTDQARYDVKWKQINTEKFRLIFPEEYTDNAISLSHIFDQTSTLSNQDLKIKTRKTPIVIQSNHIIQNGFVQLAPRKSELYPIPSAEPNNAYWPSNLAIHEWRHISQMDKMTGKLKAPFFEQLAFALYGLHLPAWYFEGDAVAIETRFSNGGRGRIPSWEMPFRANELSGKTYSFSKNIIGSFKDITPTYYHTGYILNTLLTNKYNYQINEKILSSMKNHLLRPYNFNRSLRKNTDFRNSKKLYTAAIDSATTLWKNKDHSYENYPHTTEKKSKYPESFLYPQTTGDALFYLYQTPSNINKIVKVENGKTELISYTGAQISPYFDLNGDYIVWDELRKDARFGNETFLVLHILRWKTKQIVTIKPENNLYSPAFSTDGTKLTAISVDDSGRSSLVIMDIASQKITDSFDQPLGFHLQTPRFNAQDNKIICVAIGERGTNLLEFDLESRESTLLFPWSNQQFERPTYHQDDIIFKAHFPGRDNIYRRKFATGNISQITNARFGAFHHSVTKDEKLLFNDYQHDGYKVATTELANNSNDEFRFEAKSEDNYFDHRLGSETTVETTHNTADSSKNPEIRSYNPISGLFNFHSLSLSNSNFSSLDNFRPGLFWIANDLLNTSQITLGYEYDTDLRKSIYSANLSYSKYYPKFNFGYQNRGQIGSFRRSDESIERFDWQENVLTAEVQLPFSIYRRQTIYSFGFNFGTSYISRYDLSVANLSNFKHQVILPLNYQGYFNKNRRMSRMDLQPKWGQNLSLIFRHTPVDTKEEGRQLALRGNFYFPGLLPNHGLQVRVGLQNKTGRYILNNDIPLVSGFGYFNSPNVSNTMLLTYRFPVAYPDWSIGGLTYIKRIQAHLFSDYQNIETSTLAPKTLGLGVSADFNAFRYVLPDFNAGIKLIYINDASTSKKIAPTFSLSYSY